MSITSQTLKETTKKVPKAPHFWIRDASGHPSVSVTLVIVAFLVTTAAYILSLFNKIGPIEIRPFDVGACSVYLTPLLALYGGRKWSDGTNGITQARDAMQFKTYPSGAEPNNTGIVSTAVFPPPGS